MAKYSCTFEQNEITKCSDCRLCGEVGNSNDSYYDFYCILDKTINANTKKVPINCPLVKMKW